MRPSRWSPEISSRRSGWCRTTCEGAWPGRLVHLPGAEVGLDLDARAAGRGRARAARAMPVSCACARARPSAAAAPPARRSGGRPRSAAASAASGSPARAVRCSWRGCIHSSQPGALGDRRRLAAVVDVRVRADEQPDVLEPQADLRRARARGGPSSPARACRCRRARSRRRPRAPTRCSAARRASGSGSRSRQTPGQDALAATDLAVCRVGLRIGRGTVTMRRPMRRRARRQAVADAAYFDALARRDVEAMAACWAPERLDALVGQATVGRARGRARVLRRAVRRVPRLRDRPCEPTTAQDDRGAVHWRATGTFAGPAVGHRADRRARRARGLDLFTVEDGLIVAQRRLPGRDGARPPDRAAAASRVGAPSSAMLRRLQRPHAASRGGWPRATLEPVADGVWLVRGGMPRDDERVPDRGRRRRRDGVRRRHRADDARRSPPRRAARRDQPRRARPRPRRPPRRRARPRARRCSATRPTAPTPRATAAAHYFDFEQAPPVRAAAATRGCCRLGRRPGRDRRHGRGGRRRRAASGSCTCPATRPG